MNCQNCGEFNAVGSKFCIKCGNSLETVNNIPPVAEMPNMQGAIQNVEVNGAPSPIVNNAMGQTIQGASTQPVMASSTPNVSSAPLNFFMYLILILVKPFQYFKEEEAKLSNPKTSLILSGIVAGIMMLISLLKAMLANVFVKEFDLSTFEYKTSFDLGQLKDLDYLSLIGKNLLIYAGIILGIAAIYYIAALVAKKQVNFIKFLSITATSVVPFVILGMIASPVLGKIWMPLSIVSMIMGIVYSITIFMFLIKEEIHFVNQDAGIYFHLICMTGLGVAGYYIGIKLITSSITSQLGNLMDIFG